MSNKLTKQKIDLLIEQVLNEKPLGIKFKNYNIGTIRKALGFKDDPMALSYPDRSDNRQSTIKKNVKALANLDKTPTDTLDRQDLEIAYTKNKNDALYKTAKGLQNLKPGIEDLKDLSRALEPSVYGTAPKLKTAFQGGPEKQRSRLVNAFTDGDFEGEPVLYLKALRDVLAAEDPMKASKFLDDTSKNKPGQINKLVKFLSDHIAGAPGAQKPEDVKLVVSTALDVFDKLNRSERSDFIPTVDLPYTPVQQKGARIPLKAIGKLDPSIIDTMKGFYDIDVRKLGIDANLKDTLQGRFQVIAEFAETAKNAKAGDNTAITTLQSLTPEELMSASTVLKTLGANFQTIQGSALGTVFEVFIALITGGVVKGGSGGAIDNLSGVNGDVYLSAKQFADKHKIEQAVGKPLEDEGRGLLAACQKAKSQNKKLWYISLRKNIVDVSGGESLSVQSLGLKLIGLDVDRAVNPTAFRIYNSDGDLHETVPKESPDLAKQWTTGKGGWDITPYTKDIPEIMEIPIMDQISDSVETIDKMISGALDKVNDNFLNAAKLAQNKLSGMKKDALSYSTIKGADAVTAGANLRGEYINLKDQLNIMFGEKVGAPGVQQIAEKKQTKSLKDLDKLIERVILESMNKK